MADKELVPIPGLELHREDCKTNLQYYRNLKRLTQAELAKRANVNLRTLQDYEQGQKSINRARSTTVSRLADVLGVKITDLLEYEQKEKRYGNQKNQLWSNAAAQ